ncbi:MAG TPA: hypothetical protein VE869_05260, partial [Gemmatimonas sp.]|nr:hypothetical protein [Gemmatimonas sp.]
MLRSLRFAPLALAAAVACSDKTPTGNDDTNNGGNGGNNTALSTNGSTLANVGFGAVAERFSGEVWVRGTTAYTTTWGTRGVARGNAVK